jgi:hypothetical protein
MTTSGCHSGHPTKRSDLLGARLVPDVRHGRQHPESAAAFLFERGRPPGISAHQARLYGDHITAVVPEINVLETPENVEEEARDEQDLHARLLRGGDHGAPKPGYSSPRGALSGGPLEPIVECRGRDVPE